MLLAFLLRATAVAVLAIAVSAQQQLDDVGAAPCPFDKAKDGDVWHPCSAEVCVDNRTSLACTALAVRFCFDMGPLSKGCTSVSGSVEDIFGAAPPGSYLTVNTSTTRAPVESNATAVPAGANSTRRPVLGDQRHPSAGPLCKADLFSPACVEKILRYCVVTPGSNTSAEADSKPGCDLVSSICIVAPVSSAGLGVCLGSACLQAPHSEQCLKQMEKFCQAQPVSWHCSPFQQKKKANRPTAKELHMMAMQSWVQQLAHPPADKSYNDRIYVPKVTTATPMKQAPKRGPKMHPSS